MENLPGSKRDYTGALSEYIQALAKEKLSVLRVNLDNFRYDAGASSGLPVNLNEFRYNVNPNALTIKAQYGLDLKKPETFVRAIRDISKATQTKYVVLLGDVDRIPMPDIGDREVIINGVKECEFSAKTPCKLPSDRLYALLENRRYVTKVTRIPGPDYLIDKKLLHYVKLHRAGGLQISRKEITMHVDSCGGVKVFQENNGKVAVRDCLFFEEFMNTMRSVFGLSSCTRENGCLLNPPYCLSCNGEKNECQETTLKNRLERASFLFIRQHGSGDSFSGITTKGNTILECKAGNGEYFFKLNLRNSPPIITSACYGASIDEDINGIPLFGTQGTAKSLLFAGAPFYIGSTRTNYGLAGVFTKIGPEDVLAYRTELNFIQQITRAVMSCRGRVGDCFYAQMNAYERLFQSEGIASSRWKDRQTVRQYQLYGDPTLQLQFT